MLGNLITEDEQFAKLRRVVELAAEIWGDRSFRVMRKIGGTRTAPAPPGNDAFTTLNCTGAGGCKAGFVMACPVAR